MEDFFGRIFRISDWGDTHGPFMEGRVEGCPAGILVDQDFVQAELARRAPDATALSTRRAETDEVQFLSGIGPDGRTTGEKIFFRIENRDARPSAQRDVIRPSHASYTYFKKYGFADNELCGRASARQTVCRVVAGAIAKLVLRTCGVEVTSEVVSMAAPAREGDTMGAVVRGHIRHVPAGLGEPVYDKFSARLAYAMLSINAAKGFEIGLGYEAAKMCGSDYNDVQNPDYTFRTNHDGGVQAGITNGEEVTFTVAFKPIPTVRFAQETITYEGKSALYEGSDRNDRCVAPRVLPVVEAMAAITTLDFMLLADSDFFANFAPAT
ncbi:MAG: chorismate synthase [Bacteroidales bacterium]|nr:chorismate synthase [Bacteroidales bacterium]